MILEGFWILWDFGGVSGDLEGTLGGLGGILGHFGEILGDLGGSGGSWGDLVAFCLVAFWGGLGVPRGVP